MHATSELVQHCSACSPEMNERKEQQMHDAVLTNPIRNQLLLSSSLLAHPCNMSREGKRALMGPVIIRDQ